MDEACWCTHPASDHAAGECWAQVNTPAGSGQCGCDWWEPASEALARGDAAHLGSVVTGPLVAGVFAETLAEWRRTGYLPPRCGEPYPLIAGILLHPLGRA